MQNYNGNQFVNVGTGIEHSIKNVALIIKDKMVYKGELTFNSSYPNGTPRKLMDVSKLNDLGWKHVSNLNHSTYLHPLTSVEFH